VERNIIERRFRVGGLVVVERGVLGSHGKIRVVVKRLESGRLVVVKGGVFRGGVEIGVFGKRHGGSIEFEGGDVHGIVAGSGLMVNKTITRRFNKVRSTCVVGWRIQNQAADVSLSREGVVFFISIVAFGVFTITFMFTLPWGSLAGSVAAGKGFVVGIRQVMVEGLVDDRVDRRGGFLGGERGRIDSLAVMLGCETGGPGMGDVVDDRLPGREVTVLGFVGEVIILSLVGEWVVEESAVEGGLLSRKSLRIGRALGQKLPWRRRRLLETGPLPTVPEVVIGEVKRQLVTNSLGIILDVFDGRTGNFLGVGEVISSLSWAHAHAQALNLGRFRVFVAPLFLSRALRIAPGEPRVYLTHEATVLVALIPLPCGPAIGQGQVNDISKMLPGRVDRLRFDGRRDRRQGRWRGIDDDSRLRHLRRDYLCRLLYLDGASWLPEDRGRAWSGVVVMSRWSWLRDSLGFVPLVKVNSKRPSKAARHRQGRVENLKGHPPLSLLLSLLISIVEFRRRPGVLVQ
jgi:hypothetical protein